MPISRPVATATGTEVKPAMSAAASAGTTASVNVDGVSVVRGAARTPTSAATAEAMAQAATSKRAGCHPSRVAARRFWAAARVTTPKRVNR